LCSLAAKIVHVGSGFRVSAFGFCPALRFLRLLMFACFSYVSRISWSFQLFSFFVLICAHLRLRGRRSALRLKPFARFSKASVTF
jgi:hypothetical protein